MFIPLASALLIGVIAGLRAFTAPAAVSWAAALGWLDLSGSWLAFLGYKWTPYIFTGLAVLELIGDQLPSTPSRKVPVQFGTRIVLGGLAGAAFATGGGLPLVFGIMAGVLGAAIGTFAGAAGRAKLAAAFGRDLPAALTEDLIAVGGALLLILAVR
ncbi:DUF4126 family protein [Lacibacterium aquatile]|uniref:DUF4126 family protein n=1 Tax=Lacibacterium aquatile TaxID=1168082 RepID=A0ABW5DLZ7_9PROT